MSVEIIWETPIQGAKFAELPKGKPFIHAGDIAPETVFLKTHSSAAVNLIGGMIVDMDPEQGVVPTKLRVSVWPE